MNKLIGILFGIGLLLVAMPTFAAVPNWDVTGTRTIDFVLGGTYTHDAVLVQVGDIVTGSGGYPTGGPFTYAWTITSGVVSGDGITLTVEYTLGAVGTTMHMSGTIALNGSISGAWDDNLNGGYREGTWTMPAGTAKILDIDTDDDGVTNDRDVCPGTDVDSPWLEGIGQNRWQVMKEGDVLGWYQHNVKKGIASETRKFGIEYTYGCNGHQILDMLYAKLGSMMNGHHKFGLSSSVVEDFHKDLSDGVLDGMYFIETVTVPANDADGVDSMYPLMSDVDYHLHARGTANAGDNIELDAQYSFRIGSSVEWTDAVSTYEYLGTSLLDLFVNGADVDWGSYNGAHEYEYMMPGTGALVNLKVYDTYPSNNTGNLYVDIYAKI
jgi:hypothetical protein